MNDLVQRIVNAIIRQEGDSAEATNPGNARDCPWLNGMPPLVKLAAGRYVIESRRKYADGAWVAYRLQGNGPEYFWVPRTRGEGVAGATWIVANHIAKGQTVRDLISVWAPPSDNNNTEAYVAHVVAWAGLPGADVPLWSLIEAAPPVAPAIAS